ncbi:MAG: ATP-binding protein [Bacteroidota bacterium]
MKLWIEKSDRPAVWGFFVCVGIVAGLAAYYFVGLSYLRNHLENARLEREATIRERCTSAFDDRLHDLFNVATRVSSDSSLVLFVKQNDPNRIAMAFHRLEELRNEDDLTIEIVDPQGTILAWAGRRLKDDYAEELRTVQGDSLAKIVQSGLHSYLCVGRIREGGNLMFMASRPLEFQYPIANRFIAHESMFEELSVELSQKITFHSSGAGLEQEAPGQIRIPLRDFHGAVVALISTPRLPEDALTQEFSNAILKWIRTAVAVAILVLGGLVYSRVSRAGRPWRALLVGTIILWSVRYGWRLLDFPGILVGGRLYNPSVYASASGFGLADSVGDLSLTILCLLVTIALVFRIVLRKDVLVSVTGSNSLKKAFSAASILVLTAFFLAATRGYGAAMRSFVFDSTIQYHDPASVLPDPLVVLMHTNILMLSISLVLVCAICVLLMVASLRTFGIQRLLPAVGILVLLVIAIIPVMRSLDDTPQVAWYYPLYVLFITGILLLWMSRRKDALNSEGSLFWNGIPILVFGSFLLSAPVLDLKLHEKEHQRAELLADELLRPTDTWLSFLLTEGLRSVAARIDSSVGEMSVSGAASRNLAFGCWAATPISKQGYNSALVLYDNRETEVDRFSVGMTSYEQRELLTRVFDGDEESVQMIEHQVGGRVVKSYGVWSTLRNADGQYVGSVALLLSGGQRSLFRGETELLRPTNVGNLAGSFREVYVSEFQGGQLITTSNGNWYEGMALPEDVEQQLGSQSRRFVWKPESVEGRDLETLYAGDPIRTGHVLSMSLESLDLRWHLFNIVKVLSIYSVILVLVGAWRLTLLKIRGETVRVSFRTKLFVAFAVISIVPLLLLGYYNREMATERSEQNVANALVSELDMISQRILNYVNDEEDFIHGVNDDFCESIAAEFGVDFTVFRHFALQASSRPELYNVSILDARLPGEAFANCLLLERSFFVSSEKIGLVEYAVGYKPLELNGRVIGVLSIPTLYRQKEIEEELAQRNAFVFGAYALVFGLVTIVGGFIANRFSRPLRELTSATKSVALGNLDTRLSPRSSDEIGELMESFNRMTADLKRSRQELARVERELAWKEMAKQVAHEIKNPLTPMKLAMQHVRQAFKDRTKDREKILQTVTQMVIDQIDVLSRIATEFSNFARMPERRFERFDVQELLRESIALFKEVRKIEFRSKIPDTRILLVADRDELRRVFINIIRNSVQAMEKGGTITIDSRLADRRCVIRISDTGSGIPGSIQRRVFEPNFSTKTDGSGLGLAISQKIIEELGGSISLESEVNKGTTIEISLPV